MPPTILLATLGTHGDVAPFLALGQALQHAGARPILLINPAERPWVEQAGLEAVWVGEPYDVREELRKRPAYLSSLRGGTLVMREIFVPAAETFYTATREAIQQHKPAAVVAHIALAGPVWAAREADVPLAMAHLTPLTFANPADLGHYGRATRAGLRLALPIAIRGFAHFFGIAAKRLGLPREWATFDQTVLGGDAQLGMWSPTFRPPAPGDPPGAVITGDARPAGPVEALPVEVEAFLAAGPPPVVVGLGSSAVHVAEKLHARIVRACRDRALRCVVVGGEPHDIEPGPDLLTPSWTPFAAIFPRAAVAIHHGGVGSTQTALRGGRPEIVLPFAHDQFDNAARVRQLGAGAWRYQQFASRRRLRRLLERAMDPERAERAREVARQMAAEPDGAREAAKVVLELAGT